MIYNRNRANEYLTEHDLEAVVATTPVNVSYLTGLDCWQYRDFRENMGTPGAPNTPNQAYAVLAPDKEPVLVIATGTTGFTSDLEVGHLRTYGGEGMKLPPKKEGESSEWSAFRRAVAMAEPTPHEALAAALDDLGVRKGRVGIEFSNLSEATGKYLETKMHLINLLDATEFLRFVRMVKTEEELSTMSKAAQITEKGMMRSLEAAKDGVTAGELSQTFLTEVARQGAIPDHYIFSPAGFGISGAGNYVLRRGNFTMIDCGVSFKLYYSDTGTSLIFGNGLGEVEKMHMKLWEILQSNIDCLRPGATSSEILKKFEKAYGEEGIRHVEYQGHGLGLQAREHPVINYSKYDRISDGIVNVRIDIPLEEGMVINLETPLYVLGKGSCQVERTFLIGKRKVSEITPKRDGLASVV